MSTGDRVSDLEVQCEVGTVEELMITTWPWVNNAMS